MNNIKTIKTKSKMMIVIMLKRTILITKMKYRQVLLKHLPQLYSRNKTELMPNLKISS
jgi:hypothetical protein